MKFDSDQFHVRSSAEMHAAMPEHEEAIARSADIADGIEEFYGSLDFGRRQFPSFKVAGDQTPESLLRELCESAFTEKYDRDPIARKRLEHEIKVICDAGYASYFLIIRDFVEFARDKDIPLLPRGSACGSIITYLLGISPLCPLKYDLMFERFLDPSRGDPPDIDIDICQKRRGEVIDYVNEKYGYDKVAQIGTIGVMASKQALKDVGGVMGIEASKVNAIAKLVSHKPGTTLESMMRQAEFAGAVAKEPSIARMVEYATKLEGTAKSVGRHAAGIVISPEPLIETVPLQRDAKGIIFTQWGMEDIEAAGLLKIDFLGSRNMTILGSIKNMIGSEAIDNIPENDPETYELLQRGEAKGLFQLDGDGITDVLVRVKPDKFADIAAILALYRPGPINGGVIDQYVAAKHGRKEVVYLHESMADVLESTYGVMVYQDQIMKILNRIGGIELTRAYACIKAISKKKPAEVAKFQAEFDEGARKTTDPKTAKKIFELISFFSNYGFNLAHATAYAMIAYKTAYLKAHYPTEFMAALLSSEMDGAERGKYFVDHIYDCKRMGIVIQPPNVNRSRVDFWPISVAGPHAPVGLGEITQKEGVVAQPTKVVHCNKDVFDIYIGRPGKWGNPFEIGKNGTREQVINKYHKWILQQNDLMSELHTLQGKTLGCYCSPQSCHGDILASLADGLITQKRGGSDANNHESGRTGDHQMDPAERIGRDGSILGRGSDREVSSILFGLGAIKGVGPEVIEALVKTRGDRPFASLQDVIERTGLSKIHAESLIRVGAMDQFGGRGSMIAALDGLVKGNKKAKKDNKRGQASLFGDDEEPVSLPNVPELTREERAADELKILGFYLQENPVEEVKEDAKAEDVKPDNDAIRSVLAMAKNRTDDLGRIGGTVILGGVIVRYNEKSIKTGMMARLKFQDSAGTVQAIVWPDNLSRYELHEGWMGIAIGVVEQNGESIQVVMNRFVKIDDVMEEFSRGCVITLRTDEVCPTQLDRVNRILRSRPGRLNVMFRAVNGEGVSQTYRAGLDWNVKYSRELVAEIDEVIGDGNIKMLGPKT